MPLHPCGTPAAYRRHLRHDERPCDPCRTAHREVSWRPEYAANRQHRREQERSAVTLLSRTATSCAVCDHLATWRVRGRVEDWACVDHVGAVAEQVCASYLLPLALYRIFPQREAS